MATGGDGNQYVMVVYEGYGFTPNGCCTSGGASTCTTFTRGTDMYYQIGRVSSGSISWGAAHSMPTSGVSPSVVIWPFTSGSTHYLGVLEAHQESSSDAFTSDNGYFAVGSSPTVTWSSPTQYDNNGSTYAPKIAYCASTSQVVEVHNGGSGAGWLHTATVSSGWEVSWGGNSEYVSSGIYEQPSITCAGDYGAESHANSSGNIYGAGFYWSTTACP